MGKKIYVCGEAGCRSGMTVGSLRIRHGLVEVFDWCHKFRADKGYEADKPNSYDPIKYRARVYEFDEDKPDVRPKLLKGAGLVKFLNDPVYASLHIMAVSDKEAAEEAAKQPGETLEEEE